MNKLSKLTALLLAIVLALGVPMQVMAESAENTVKDVIDTLTEYLQVADTALYEKIMSFTTYAEYAEVEQYLTDDHVIAYIAQNDEARVSKIQDHLNDLFWAASASYAGYVGPILHTIDVSTSPVSTFSLLSRDGEIGAIAEETTSGFSDHDGLELEKSATKNDSGTYTISLEAYAEGTVKTTTISTPVDVVVVMDLSSSMTSDFNGQQRIAALKTAVRNFIATYDDDGNLIGGVASTYSSDADHRIALVGYSSAVRVDTGWVETNTAGVTSLRNTVSNMTTNQGTHTDYGMQRAVELLDPDEDYSYTGVNTNRQKVVVLFTDGVPSTSGSNDFTPTYARDAINAAYTLKNDESIKATVWSVAVVSGANPEATLSSNTAASGGNATTNAPKINLMMHAISSNYPKATATATNDLLTVTLDTGSNQGYYLSATTPDELNDIFSDIAETVNTGSSNVTLDSTTVLKDVVTPYFDLPSDASSIKVYTVDCVGFNTDGTPIWDTTDGVENKVAYSATVKFGTTDSAGNTTNITDAPTEISNTVWVENFDYSANYVANVDHDDPLDRKDPVDSGTDFYGRKLVIEFDVTPTEGFLGGNDVVTNEVTSGIYEKTEEGYDPFEDFEVPDVDVDLWKIQVIGKHQHIFLSNEADMNALLQSFSLQYTKEGSPDDTYTVDGILNNYATLVFTLKAQSGQSMRYVIEPGKTVGVWEYYDAAGNKIDDAASFDVTPFLTDDTTPYTISYNVIPIKKEDGSEGVEETRGTLTVGVHVYKPTFTFRDTTEKYLSDETAKNYYKNNNYVSESWSHTYYGEITVTINVTYDANGTPSYSYVATQKDGMQIASDSNWDMATETIDFSGYASTAGIDYYVKMSGPKPTVEFTYSPVETEWIKEGKVTAVECVPVDVTKVKLTSTNTHDKVIRDASGAVTGTDTYTTTSVYTEGSAVATADASNNATVAITKDGTTTTKDVSGAHVETLRNKVACEACKTTVETVSTNVNDDGTDEFVIHITDVLGDLIIQKTGLRTGESAIFTATITPPANSGDAVKEYTVVLTGTSDDGKTTVSVTLADLLANSTYNVTESGDWSWRYAQTNSSGTSGSIVAAGEVTASFTNSRDDQWLDDEVAVQNNFSTNGQGTVID